MDATKSSIALAVPSLMGSAVDDKGVSLTEDLFWDRVQPHLNKLYNFAWRLSGNAADASDLVQDSLARAFEARHQYDPARPMDAWIGKILHNRFLDNTRRYERRNAVSLDGNAEEETASLSDLLPGRDPTPSEQALRDEEDFLVRKILAQLPPLYRAAVVLCDIEGYSYEDMAHIMGIPVGTVRSRIHQGRRLFRDSFVQLEKGAVS